MKKFDDKISKALKESIVLSEDDKQKTWNNINIEIKKEKRKNLYSYKLIAIAAVLLIAISSVLNTEVGYALINHIKDFIVPEKVVEEIIEGESEEKTVKSNISEKNNYVIYIDEERYTMVNGKDSDKIVPKDWDNALPEVSMEVKQIVDQKPEDLINDIYENSYLDFKMSIPEKITNPIDGWRIYSQVSEKWDSPVIVVYVTSNKKNGSFIIIQKYFLEATEGHGSRLDNMLREFEIININEE